MSCVFVPQQLPPSCCGFFCPKFTKYSFIAKQYTFDDILNMYCHCIFNIIGALPVQLALHDVA